MNKKRFIAPFLVFVSVAVFLFGCGGTREGLKGTTQTVLEKIPNISQPEWVTSTKEFQERDGNYYYRGLTEGYTDLEASIRGAVANARTKLGEQIKDTMRSEFKRAMEAQKYDPTVGGYLSDSFVSVVNNIDISGSIHSESYSEKISEVSQTGEKLFYRSYVLLQFPKASYEQAVKRAFNDLAAQIEANKSAKELSVEVEKRFYENENKK